MASGVSGHVGEPIRSARSLAALAETIKKFVNMFQVFQSNCYNDASAGGRWAAGGTATHVSMHLRAGGGRQSDPHLYACVLGASWEQSSENLPKNFRKSSQKPPKIRPKSYPKGAPARSLKNLRFFLLLLRLLGASWAVWAASWGRLGASWGCPRGVLDRLGVSWGRLGASWERLGTSWARLGAPLWCLSFF